MSDNKKTFRNSSLQSKNLQAIGGTNDRKISLKKKIDDLYNTLRKRYGKGTDIFILVSSENKVKVTLRCCGLQVSGEDEI